MRSPVPSYRALHDGWLLSGADLAGVPATVPGCVHTDLLAAGLIDDPYTDDNEQKVAWIGRTDWVYQATFHARPDADRVDLVCAGLDTVATVELNGVELGRTANMHRSYRFDTRPALRPGANTLRVRFDSAYRYAEAQQDRLGDRPNAYPQPFNFIRKMACAFGSDWGPALVTAGIWQDIGLHCWSVARIAEVRPQVTVRDGVGRVDVHVLLDRDSDGPVTVVAAVAGREAVARISGRQAVLSLTVDDPELWWPRGYGGQPRYDLDVTVSDSYGKLDVWSRRIGFRTVRLDTHDGAFTVVVNDRPVFVRGVDWIPDDVFLTRVDRDRLAGRLTQACEANVNLVRVWGGGRYESEDFYDLADEYGLLVQQDFLVAGAAYPEEEPFATEVAAEARENVVRLSPHPSLVLWTGSSESYVDLLPAIVSEVDPGRPYRPDNPWADSTDGGQAPPAWATLRRALSDDPLAPDSPGMVHHQKAIGGDRKLERGLAAHLPAPRDFDDWHYLAQLHQARALARGIEHLRSRRPFRMGAVAGQFNDCWPGTSWSAVDGDGRRKPLWYALRRVFADRLLTIQPRTGGPALVAVNDGGTTWEFTATVSLRDLAGAVLDRVSVPATVDPGTVLTVPLDMAPGSASELLVADADGERAWWFGAEDKDIPWPPPAYTAGVEQTAAATRVTVTARTTLRDLTLYPDRLHPDAEVDRAGVTLLPGESVTFTVTGVTGPDPAALTRRPVLRCVNDLGQA